MYENIYLLIFKYFFYSILNNFYISILIKHYIESIIGLIRIKFDKYLLLVVYTIYTNGFEINLIIRINVNYSHYMLYYKYEEDIIIYL